jgi:hypothetical protein
MPGCKRSVTAEQSTALAVPAWAVSAVSEPCDAFPQKQATAATTAPINREVYPLKTGSEDHASSEETLHRYVM